MFSCLFKIYCTLFSKGSMAASSIDILFLTKWPFRILNALLSNGNLCKFLLNVFKIDSYKFTLSFVSIASRKPNKELNRKLNEKLRNVPLSKLTSRFIFIA